MNLRCYCCGKEIGALIALVTPSVGKADVHRVFVMLPACSKRADGTVEIVRRKRYSK